MSDMKIAGLPLGESTKVAIMIHGRGASASSILSLERYLKLNNFTLIAPEAYGNTWYPYSFMAPDQSNEPSLSQALDKIESIVHDFLKQGYSSTQIYFIGFSQGACLSLEYVARNAKKYGGIVAFTGGLIGEKLDTSKYLGDFDGTPIFIGSSQQDMHVPLDRIYASVEVLEKMHGKVKTLIFPDPEHTIREEEIDWVNSHIL
ncbi:alpha/beta hydrolase [Belliella kenyensis]|uniref:Alpha/beta hydrolase n=1 Tax=Belliella kenyensis TaxID=1472724 RepID=A0ABV8EPR8_9BACT|nr:dienelactone hydrolase family protein [Belliella kenyensis]MCH7400602.1 alpha/beta hydrolase [Belliella kenyensis]MDN3602111.1 dienelactone hydrolase family protein [Belliella kenyensis]